MLKSERPFRELRLLFHDVGATASEAVEERKAV